MTGDTLTENGIGDADTDTTNAKTKSGVQSDFFPVAQPQVQPELVKSKCYIVAKGMGTGQPFLLQELFFEGKIDEYMHTITSYSVFKNFKTAYGRAKSRTTGNDQGYVLCCPFDVEYVKSTMQLSKAITRAVDVYYFQGKPPPQSEDDVPSEQFITNPRFDADLLSEQASNTQQCGKK